MAWRSRYFEVDAYRPLLKEYTASGAKWTTPPRPALVDALYNHDYRLPEAGEPIPFVVNEYEPVFDAADFVRCGRDLFGVRGNVTNESGVHRLRTHFGDRLPRHPARDSLSPAHAHRLEPDAARTGEAARQSGLH